MCELLSQSVSVLALWRWRIVLPAPEQAKSTAHAEAEAQERRVEARSTNSSSSSSSIPHCAVQLILHQQQLVSYLQRKQHLNGAILCPRRMNAAAAAAPKLGSTRELNRTQLSRCRICAQPTRCHALEQRRGTQSAETVRPARPATCSLHAARMTAAIAAAAEGRRGC